MFATALCSVVDKVVVEMKRASRGARQKPKGGQAKTCVEEESHLWGYNSAAKHCKIHKQSLPGLCEQLWHLQRLQSQLLRKLLARGPDQHTRHMERSPVDTLSHGPAVYSCSGDPHVIHTCDPYTPTVAAAKPTVKPQERCGPAC